MITASHAAHHEAVVASRGTGITTDIAAPSRPLSIVFGDLFAKTAINHPTVAIRIIVWPG